MNAERILKVGKYSFPLGKRTWIMGIINVTPDSFSDGGKYHTVEQALNHAKQLAEEGADFLDIGGESTRPGFAPVSLDEELDRVIPVIERIAKEVDLPISVDTYKAEVARQAILAGAHIINDIWGAKKDPDMAKVAADLDVPIILMHNRIKAEYQSLMEEMQNDLLESVRLVKQRGVREENIILDPGIGFGKTYEDNLTVMRHLDKVVDLGYPVLLGTSRKSMIGHTLDLPVDERIEGTAATVALGTIKGCHIMRVHDVKEMVRVCRMMDAMLHGPSRQVESFHG
jgi:dihydropteroate synthase